MHNLSFSGSHCLVGFSIMNSGIIAISLFVKSDNELLRYAFQLIFHLDNYKYNDENITRYLMWVQNNWLFLIIFRNAVKSGGR